MSLKLRQIKSFVLRQGKITTGQQHALDQLLPIYGIKFQNIPLNLDVIFGRNNPKIIEIGFGMGHATAEIAQTNPENDYLGIEVHGPGVGSLLMSIRDNNLSNLRVIQHDAIEVLTHMISNNSISGFHIFFPDPWHKKRHHKRRIIQTEFINLLCDKLKVGGYIHLATDWEDYAAWMLDILRKNTPLTNASPTDDFVTEHNRPSTKFEKRGLNLGHKIWDLKFIKK